MYEELIALLRKKYDKAPMVTEAADAIEELSQVIDAIPHVCECCIGCEVESGGCDNAFVLSPKRAREYLRQPRWIPVTDRLPEDSKNVLAAFDDGVLIAFYGNHEWIEAATYSLFYPTHWMPLPPIPKED